MNVREMTKRHPETCSWLFLLKRWNWIFVFTMYGRVLIECFTLSDEWRAKFRTLILNNKMKFVFVYILAMDHIFSGVFALFHLFAFWFLVEWKTLNKFRLYALFLPSLSCKTLVGTCTHWSASRCKGKKHELRTKLNLNHRINTININCGSCFLWIRTGSDVFLLWCCIFFFSLIYLFI